MISVGWDNERKCRFLEETRKYRVSQFCLETGQQQRHLASCSSLMLLLKNKVWRYRKGNQKPDNTMAKRKRIKGNTMMYKIPRIKSKIKQSKPHRSEPMCSWRVSSTCSTCGTRRVTIGTKPVISHEWGTYKIAIHNNFHTVCYSFLSYAGNVLSTIGCLFVLFPLATGLFVLVRFTASD